MLLDQSRNDNVAFVAPVDGKRARVERRDNRFQRSHGNDRRASNGHRRDGVVRFERYHVPSDVHRRVRIGYVSPAPLAAVQVAGRTDGDPARFSAALRLRVGRIDAQPIMSRITRDGETGCHRATAGKHAAMQAIRIHEYGGPDVLRFEETSIPKPGPGQVLIRVHAAGVGPWDALVRTGSSGLQQTLPLIPGSDIAGVIEHLNTGESTGLAESQAVYGLTNAKFTDGYAQYAAADLRSIAPKPERLSFVEAASVPVVRRHRLADAVRARGC